PGRKTKGRPGRKATKTKPLPCKGPERGKQRAAPDASSLVGRAEQLDLFAHRGLDRLGARGKQLARVVALALLVLTGFNVLTGGRGKAELAFGVDVDRGHAEADPLADHLVRDAGAAVQHERDVVGGLVDLVQRVKVEALPVGG